MIRHLGFPLPLLDIRYYGERCLGFAPWRDVKCTWRRLTLPQPILFLTRQLPVDLSAVLRSMSESNADRPSLAQLNKIAPNKPYMREEG